MSTIKMAIALGLVLVGYIIYKKWKDQEDEKAKMAKQAAMVGSLITDSDVKNHNINTIVTKATLATNPAIPLGAEFVRAYNGVLSLFK